ncbi:MAG TPA: hypothetical protein VMF59_05795, partial [Bacteroidota bacterium]|nr:hypothetical protein [Bacteroidota bacterium]
WKFLFCQIHFRFVNKGFHSKHVKEIALDQQSEFALELEQLCLGTFSSNLVLIEMARQMISLCLKTTQLFAVVKMVELNGLAEADWERGYAKIYFCRPQRGSCQVNR